MLRVTLVTFLIILCLFELELHTGQTYGLTDRLDLQCGC